MKVLVMGCGNIGSVATEHLAKNMNSVKVFVADKDKAVAKSVAQRISKENVSWIQLDVTDREKLVDALKDYDLVMGFLPGRFGYRLMEACIEARKDLVDVSYMPENPLVLASKAAKAKVTIIPDCGLAPGISNVLVGHAVTKLDKIKAIHIMVGGLPEKPIPPLGYVITWSPENLIDEYMRKATMVKEGKKVEIEALTGVEEVKIPNFGKLEAFFTDGLRTLLHTMPNVRDMWEKTLRYPGHAEKIKVLKALGFFEEEMVDVEGLSLSPRRLTAKLLQKKLWKPEVKDVVVLKIEVLGDKNGRETSYVYDLLDYYDEKSGTTAMARTTAYPASIIAQLLLKKTIKGKGVVPPENVGKDNVVFESFLKELEKCGVKVVEEKVEG